MKQDKIRRDIQLYQEEITLGQQRDQSNFRKPSEYTQERSLATSQSRKIVDYLLNKFSKKSKRSSILAKLKEHRELEATNFNLHIIINLLGIINDTFLNDKTQLAYDVLTRIFEILGAELEPDLKFIIPLLMNSEIQMMEVLIILIRDCDVSPFVSEITEYCLTSDKSESMSLFTDSMDILSYKYHALLRPKIDRVMEKLYQIVQ